MNPGKFVCDSCGGRSFFKKDGCYECEYCGSIYMLEDNENVVGKVLTDSKIVEYYLEATKHMLKENYSEEFAVLSKALELDPHNATTLVKIGRCYRKLGMQDKAIDAYNKAIEINPEMGTVYTNMGTIYILNEQWDKADALFKKGLPLIDKKEDDYWTAYANYAIVVAKLGDLAKAEQMINEAEQHGYENADGVREMAGLKKQGCYIATCVYGSYDCPEVWVLRRYRDFNLAETRLGRLFIKFYYSVSPALVERFGNTRWFKTLWKGILDSMIVKLQKRGYEDTQYCDKSFKL